MFTFYDKKYGTLCLVAKPSGVKVKKGTVLAMRKSKGKMVTDAFSLEAVGKKVPKTILKEYGWISEDSDLKDVIETIQSKTFGNKTIIVAPEGIDFDEFDDIDDNTPIETVKALIKLHAQGKNKGIKLVKLK